MSPPPAIARAGLVFLLALLTITAQAAAPPVEYYHDPAWKPRAILPAEDALRGDFWPPSPPPVDVNCDDPGFAADRLVPAPPPGVYPRVVLTPADIETIQKKIAMGDRAPAAFRALWERFGGLPTAFNALVTDNAALGRELADGLMLKVASLESKMDRIEAQPDRDNIWNLERSMLASGDPDPPTEIWALADYDYLHKWMTPAERTRTEKLLLRLTNGRISNYLTVPAHFMINNHGGFGMEFLRLVLLVEGLPGFDPRVRDLSLKKVGEMLDWYLSPAGMSYESIKGWMNTSVFVALARRDPDILKNSRWRSKMDFFQHAAHWEDGQWRIRDEMRASAFHVIWMMRYFHPGNRGYDWLYSATFSTHPFLLNPKDRWPNPVGVSNDLLLLFVGDGLRGKDGKPLDWNSPGMVASLGLPLTWKDDLRGYVITRNSWRPDDLQLGFTQKQDFFYGGHEGSENNRFVLWADGINWARDSNMLAVKASFLQNMLTIDGRGVDWPPAPGVWLGAKDSPCGLIAAGDGKIATSYAKVMQVHPLDFPSVQTGYYKPFAQGNYGLSRDQQVAFHPGTVAWNDGYAHTDYGPWSGETRLVEDYRTFNPVEMAYRTVYLARGAHPYVLIMDDARKDAGEHLFEWNMTFPEGLDLLDARTEEIQFQQVPPGAGRMSDLLIGRAATPRDPDTNRAVIAKGEPLLLVRTLWRNTSYGFPVPRFEKLPVEPQAPYNGLGHLTIPAISTAPEFRVLLYPHRQGDPIPVTKWNPDRTRLSVTIGETTDTYHFHRGDGGRTVFSVERDGQPVTRSEARPAAPTLIVRGERFTPSDLRTTRREGESPQYVFDGHVTVRFEIPPAPAFITYTLDGSEPTASSPRCDGPLVIENSSRLTARIVDPEWTAGPQEGVLLTADFVRTPPAAGLPQPPPDTRPGLLCRVYEKKTVLWDDKGFFRANKPMLPDLDKETPIFSGLTDGFSLPFVTPVRPRTEQAKGFYRFTGWYFAPDDGVYKFLVDSCGPVLLKASGRDVIAATGVFHQNQSVRTGEAVLGSGWHAIELIVTDPLFWNIATTDEMPFQVRVARDGHEAEPIPASALRGDASHAPDPPRQPLTWIEPERPPSWLEPGALLATHARAGKMDDPDYLDVGKDAPLREERADLLEDNPLPDLVRDYRGWFHAPEDGTYRFDMPARTTGRDALSGRRAACQNQIRIGNHIVVQRGIPNLRTTGTIGLKRGWYPISIRLGSSAATGTVEYPDGQTCALTAALMRRESRIGIAVEDGGPADSVVEIYGPTHFTLSKPDGREGVIHYTLDGTPPTRDSPVYSEPVLIEDSATLSAAAVLPDGSRAGGITTVIRRVDSPAEGLVAAEAFGAWDGGTGPRTLANGTTVWINPAATRAKETPAALRTAPAALPPAKVGIDINVNRDSPRPTIGFSKLNLSGKGLTVGAWFRSDTGSGQIFGKDGLTPFGKSYKTASVKLADGKLLVEPGRWSTGKLVPPGEWVHVVLTADDQASRLYLNGDPVGSGPGSASLATDSLDFFTNHPGLIGEVRIYDRLLSPGDVRQWFESLRKPGKPPHGAAPSPPPPSSK